MKLSEVDLNLSLGYTEYKTEIKDLQEKARLLTHYAFKKKRTIILVFEGWDAAGKGGSIRRLTSTFDPRLYTVKSIAAPNEVEKKHHYLWRFWTTLPEIGHVGIYDRSWYGRVLVERVENFATEEEWSRSYEEINGFEKDLTDNGAILIKYWLHISFEEQFKRFNARKNDPLKRWKLTDEDWRNREKWGKYEEAANEMFAKTSKIESPWAIISANDKYNARVSVLRTFCENLKKSMDIHKL
ncbi:MAG: UDP-galactose-lipid carrier transferase [Leptospiraceae bacterium]|nr:UDP-galactose-lipid carrier transferase [Leptospiraceae bacterium]MCK6379716.1 UDP-galactose-lipid carrier transferase [Leptospiraceae bacterium]NUM41219.1 UDP-galactose-lipid carrier transferase [Leptospiraceae bacterium]